MDASLFENARRFDAKPAAKAKAKNSCLTIVYAKTGKRIELSKAIHEMLGNVEKIDFSFDLKQKILFAFADENGSSVKISKNKAVIYNAPLVKEITEKFNLDFNGQTSISFNRHEAVEGNDNVVGIYLA